MRERASDLSVTRQGHSVVTQNKQFQVKFDLSKGTWDYLDQTGHTIIRNAYARIALQGGKTLATSDKDGIREFSTYATAEDEFGIYQPVKFSHQSDTQNLRINLYLNCYSKAPFIILTAAVENLGDTQILLDRITVIGVSSLNPNAHGGIYLGGIPSDYHIFLNMNPSLTQGVKKIYDGFSINKKGATQACYDGVLYDTTSRRSLVFGFLSAQKWWSTIDVGYNSQTQKKQTENGLDGWALRHRCEHQPCAPGAEIESEPVYLNFSGPASQSYDLYAGMVAQRMNAQNSENIFSGWYAPQNEKKKLMAAEYILDQVGEISQTQASNLLCPGNIDYIELEDGSKALLELEQPESEDTPDKMKTIVEKIHKKGLKVVMRINPFDVPIDSKLTKNHPELFLQNRNGKPASVSLEDGTKVALFDVSQPGAGAHVRQCIRKIVDGWECDLIKADLFSYAVGPLAEFENFQWHDKSLTSIELYRLGIHLLNQAIQDSPRKALLEGHNTCYMPSIGGFSLNYPLSTNGNHIGNGLWNDARGLKHAISTHAAYLATHNTMWVNEFGAIMVDEPHPINEALVAVTAAALSGEIVTCADNLSTLNPERMEFLEKLFPLTGQTAIPVDLYENRFPQIWNMRLQASYDEWNVVGIFNWKDQVDDVHLTLNALGLDENKFYLVHDFWNREYLGVVRRAATISNMPSRSVRLLCFRHERDTPQLLSTDMHFSQGSVEILSAGWDEKSQSFLTICKPSRKGKGTLFIHVPEDFVPAATSCYGANYQYRLNTPIYELTLSPTSELIHASVRFEKTSG